MLKELRIGNYIQDATGELLIITELNSNKGEQNVHAWPESLPFAKHPFKPLEINYEILFKLGFRKQVQNVYSIALDDQRKLCIVLPPMEGKQIVYITDDSQEQLLIHDNIQVHTLQNLYFVLCQKELKINHN